MFQEKFYTLLIKAVEHLFQPLQFTSHGCFDKGVRIPFRVKQELPVYSGETRDVIGNNLNSVVSITKLQTINY